MTMTTYTIEQLDKESLYTTKVLRYLVDVGPVLTKKFDNEFDWKHCQVDELVEKCTFLVCKRNDEITGHLIAHLYNSPLDSTVKIFYQISFYAKPDSGRTAYHLFRKFIDIGKERADHIITMLTTETNIKSSTLENMGFKETETLYRMRTK